MLLSSILDRIASGYVPFPNIGSANQPRLNCNALSVASTSSESVLFGISQLLFSEIPTCPKVSKGAKINYRVNEQLHNKTIECHVCKVTVLPAKSESDVMLTTI